MIYGTQSSCDKILQFTGLSTDIYISYAMKLRKLRTLKNDNIGPSKHENYEIDQQILSNTHLGPMLSTFTDVITDFFST